MSRLHPEARERCLSGALKEISANKGILYDADVADARLQLFKQRRFRF